MKRGEPGHTVTELVDKSGAVIGREKDWGTGRKED
jgi:hypothetical protein